MPDSTHSGIQLATLAAALVLQQEESARAIILGLREKDTEREQVRETILQTYLFDGYPTALEGQALLAEVWPGDPNPVEPGDFTNWEEWESRGRDLYRKIYGDVADRLQERAKSFTPELARWMIIEGYGKVLSRGVLTDVERELINVAVLVVKQRPRQLHSHLRGALRVGADRSDLEKLLNALDLVPGSRGIGEAREMLHEIVDSNTDR